jgi:transglutaminase-like putative cysteine protease
VIDQLKTDVVLTAGQFVAADNTLLRHTFTGAENTSSPIEDETVFLSTPRIYKPEEGYSITTGVSQPSQAQLTGAGVQYPVWITGRYLQIPAELPQSVKRLSQNITRRAQTPYDKVIAVRNYLAQLTYDENGSFPPGDSDAVENFLSIQKKGNCTNFATSAVVLLRSAGVPARFCTGYIPHTFDQKSTTYIVQARDYHAWPEVYFPGYGWVEFEVTPGGSTELVAPINPGQTGSDSSFPDLNYFQEGYIPPDGGADNAAAAPPQEDWSRPLIIIIVVLLLLAAGIELGLRAWNRTFQRADYSAGTYAKLWFTASLMKLPGSPQQTPREFGENLAGFVPEQKKAIMDITRAYMDYRYGGHKGLDIKKKQALRHSWVAISWAMLKMRISRVFKSFSL